MKNLGKALIALATVVAAIGLHGTPAPANDVLITSGTLDLYSADSFLLDSYVYGSPTSTQCSSNTDTFDVTGTGAWTATFASHTSFVLGGVHFTLEIDASFSGTSSTTGTMSGTGSAQARFYRNSSTSCDHIGGTPCVVNVSGVDVGGLHTVVDHEVEASDEAVISGNNGDHGDFGFEVSVSGTATACGVLFSLDDGSLTLSGLTIHATT